MLTKETVTKMIPEKFEQIVGVKIDFLYDLGTLTVTSNHTSDNRESLKMAKQHFPKMPLYICIEESDKNREIGGTLTVESARELGNALIAMADYIESGELN